MEIDLDWSDPAAVGGIRHATVIDVQQKTSKKGDSMLEVTFELDGGGRVRDYLMLGGDGKGMGMAKLGRLGVPKDTPKLNLAELAGRELDLVLVAEDYNGQPQLKVDGKANQEPWRLGYGRVADPKPVDPNAVPF